MKLSVLVEPMLLHDGEPWWIAQFIELNLLTQARNLNDLAIEIGRVNRAQAFAQQDVLAVYQTRWFGIRWSPMSDEERLSEQAVLHGRFFCSTVMLSLPCQRETVAIEGLAELDVRIVA